MNELVLGSKGGGVDVCACSVFGALICTRCECDVFACVRIHAVPCCYLQDCVRERPRLPEQYVHTLGASLPTPIGLLKLLLALQPALNGDALLRVSTVCDRPGLERWQHGVLAGARH